MMKHRGKIDYSGLEYDTLFELGQEVYYNAYSLLFDACLLYGLGSYSTAYALAVLSLEECGKFEGLDHVSLNTVLNEGLKNGFKSYALNRLFSGKQFYNHNWKQQYASRSVKDRTEFSDIEINIKNGKLDMSKQQALYVDLEHGEIGTPARFTAEKAMQMISYTFEVFKEIRDLPFYDVFEDSTDETKLISGAYINDIQELISSFPSSQEEVFASDIVCFLGKALKVYESSLDDSDSRMSS